MAGKGKYTPLEHRNGLALFLRRGMWSWSQQILQTNTKNEKNKPVHLNQAATQPVLVEIFASLIMNAV